MVSGGCAAERAPINRVQANALAKSFFVGANIGSPADDPEFYAAGTIVDVPYGTDSASVFGGLGGSLQRVKWEITEKQLNARVTYESVEGVDGHGAKKTNTGKIIASYSIVSHFDIRKGYNPSTGEELNVVEENSSDRPWYAREYFRVDWSSNSITSSHTWDPIAEDGWDVEPLSYYVSDPAHPDAPHFDTDTGYFDITSKLYIKPKVFHRPDGSSIPACYYYGSLVAGGTYPWGQCENSEITVRYSYKRIGQPGEAGFTDYQPIDWDGSRMNAFGIFTRDRVGWDRNYGVVDDKWHRFGQRYNIWERSHTDRKCAAKEDLARGLDPQRDIGDLDKDGKADPGAGPNGTDDECEDGSNTQWGSRCDYFVGKCTIPFSRRVHKPVAWHYTVNMADKVIYDSTEFATWQWDAAMRTAVQSARYVECVRTGTASLIGSKWNDTSYYANGVAPQVSIDQIRGTCRSLFNIDNSHDDAELDSVRDMNICVRMGKSRATCVAEKRDAECGQLQGDDQVNCINRVVNSVAAMDPAVVLCANPVTDKDHPSCGAPGTVARPGDIRYHQVNVWPTRQGASPWGFGPSLSDPLTGEIIAANINVYNSVTDAAAQSFVDQARWINGEISAKDITSGKFVHDWVQSDVAKMAQGGALLSNQELERRTGSIGGLDLAKVDISKIDPKLIGQVDKTLRDLDREVVPPGVIPEDRAVFDARIKKAKDTGVEAELMNVMWLQMAGGEQNLPYEQQLDKASPLRGMSSRTALHDHDHMQQKLASKGLCVLGAPEPTGIPAIAKLMQRKFPYNPNANATENHDRLQKMWDYLRWKMNFTVILHEMGHTIGERHNFVSSYDKYSYKPQYWQLRTNSGKDKKMCTGPVADGKSCIGPRYWDPLTQEEIDNSVWTWMQSSVMDYAGDLTQDMIGLGVYDMAATRMFYADVVDMRDDVNLNASGENKRRAESVMQLVDYPGYLWGQAFVKCPQGTGKCANPAPAGFPANENIGHYSFYNEAFKLVQPERCKPVTPTQPSWWSDDKYGKWDPLWDGQIVKNERCARPPVDYMSYGDLVPDQIGIDYEDPRFFTPRRAKDTFGRPRVPYGFLTDNYADGWSPTAYRHDNGADIYEAVLFHTNLYENRHIFDNFRNGRVTFSVYNAYQRALARYHAKIENLTQGFAYTINFVMKSVAHNGGYKFEEVVKAYAGYPGAALFDHSVAAAVGFDHFVRVMTRPHNGQHHCRSGGLPGTCEAGGDRLLKPSEDEFGLNGISNVGHMPNGNMVAGNSLSHGARPINNDFQHAHGHWTWNYLNQAGSYYEKTFATQSMLNASYGAINFYRFDGLDARFRHVNFSNLYPEGMRRFIGAALTEDASLLASRITSRGDGQPDFADATDPAEKKAKIKYPADPLAWVSYVAPNGPTLCAPVGDVVACSDSDGGVIQNGSTSKKYDWFVDPQLGYEVQKFMVFWFYVYQPAAETLDWVDLARIYRLGTDTSPDYLPANTVEWRDPESGLRYIAKRFGDEQLFGKTYDKGIAAKMIQWANQLTSEIYENDGPDPVTGAIKVKFNTDGSPKLKGNTPKNDSKKWLQLRRYRGLLDYTRDVAAKLGFPEPALQIFTPGN
jgi:hypothetical protein